MKFEVSTMLPIHTTSGKRKLLAVRLHDIPLLRKIVSYTYMSMLCKVTLSKQEVKSLCTIKGVKSMVVKAIKTQEIFRI